MLGFFLKTNQNILTNKKLLVYMHNPLLVIFLDRDFFKSLIPCLGKNVSVLLIGWIKNLACFLTS